MLSRTEVSQKKLHLKLSDLDELREYHLYSKWYKLGYRCQNGHIARSTKCWHGVELLAMPLGSTFHQKHWAGAWKLGEGILKASCFQSSRCRGIVKKQSFKFKISKWFDQGIAVGDSKPGCKGPISSIVLLAVLKSSSNLLFPPRFLLYNKNRSILWPLEFEYTGFFLANRHVPCFTLG